MAQKPEGRQYKDKVIPFRATPELGEWIESRVDQDARVSRTDVVLWIIQHGRDFIEASKGGLDERIKKYARANDLTERGALRRIIEAGLKSLGA